MIPPEQLDLSLVAQEIAGNLADERELNGSELAGKLIQGPMQAPYLVLGPLARRGLWNYWQNLVVRLNAQNGEIAQLRDKLFYAEQRRQPPFDTTEAF